MMVSIIAGAALLMAIMFNFALADCFDRAWSYYSIDPDYLRAISWQESRFNNAAINGKSAGGTTDYCMMQINSRTLSDLRREYPSLNKDKLYSSPCLCIHVGAMLLRRNFSLSLLVVGMYNAGMSNKQTSVQNRYNYAMLINDHYKKYKHVSSSDHVLNDLPKILILLFISSWMNNLLNTYWCILLIFILIG